MSVVLPPEFESFVNERVATGAYSSQGEVLRAAFELLEQRENLLAHIDEGTDQLRSGRFSEYDALERDRFRADIESAAARINSSGDSA